ncbi:hypothetical protein B0H14DRAFT_3125545 [Mycena olivaceomarginata]|nr:hypothetical protein B0H14DRAFT_3125545 [Mycena olivaceomarginata]
MLWRAVGACACAPLLPNPVHSLTPTLPLVSVLDRGDDGPFCCTATSVFAPTSVGVRFLNDVTVAVTAGGQLRGSHALDNVLPLLPAISQHPSMASDACHILANPDISGIGVRVAIYAQNLLSTAPA